MKRRVVALVPMRHHSERVPGKNYRLFAGRPLFHHIIGTLLDCPLVSQVVIDTDSGEIAHDAAKRFPEVRIVERPQHLRAGDMAMNDVLLHTTSQVEADCYLQTHSTNPLLRSQTITAAIERFVASIPMYDSCFGVTRLQTRLWDQLTRAVNHNPDVLLRTQDLPPILEENSNLYIFSRQTLETHHRRIGNRPMMFEIGRLEAWDIDEELDFRVAEFLYLERERNGAGR